MTVPETREALVDTILTRAEEAADMDEPDHAVSSLVVDMGFYATDFEAADWLVVADAIYERFDINDYEYNRALSRCLDPRPQKPGEGASALADPAQTVAIELAVELLYPATGATPIRSGRAAGRTECDYDASTAAEQEDGTYIVQMFNFGGDPDGGHLHDEFRVADIGVSNPDPMDPDA